MKPLIATLTVALVGTAGAQVAPVVAPLGAPPPPLPPRFEKSLRGMVPDGRLDCIRPVDAVGRDSAGDSIIWKPGRDLAYRNDTSGGCFGLRDGDTIRIESPKRAICKGDIVKTSERTTGTPSGTCTLGEFVRYARPKAR